MKQTAYVINLAHRTDRWEAMKQKWSEYFDLVQVNGIILPPDDRPHVRVASEGLGYTHMKLLTDAKQRGEKTILILEDDAVPEPQWFERWTEIKEYLDSHLSEWDVFNGGVHFLRHYHGVKELKHSCLIDGRLGCAAHFMYLNLDAYFKFMTWPEDKTDIDMFYCNNFRLYCAYPILSKQADGQSDIVSSERHWFITYLQNEAEFRHKLGDVYFKYRHEHRRF